MEKRWASEEGAVMMMMEFPVQRWLSVDQDDGDIVREVSSQLPGTDKPPGIVHP